MKRLRLCYSLIVCLFIITVFPGNTVYADGTEGLGATAVTPGTGKAVFGVGLRGIPDGCTTGNINTNVSGSVEQVLLYWQGQHFEADLSDADDMITVDGNNVAGSLIGGPTNFFGDVYVSTFRADITGLGLISSGADSIAISNMDFGRRCNGASVFIVLDDGTDTADIQLRDGQDLAFLDFAPTLNATVPQTFNFAPSTSSRTAKVCFAAGGTSGDDRGSTKTVTVNPSNTVNNELNPLGANDGDDWDSLCDDVTIPANDNSLTAEIQSTDTNSGLPASFGLIVASLAIVPEEEMGDEGCTPGFWCNRG
ncbi:MAG: hypothetical protein ACR2NW_06065, partial [Thermodesulfobacteriota bacterium]